MLIDIKKAFDLMIIYLDKYYERTDSYDIGGLLGDAMILEDGTTADPALMDDWLLSVVKITNKSDNNSIDIKCAYLVLIDFLKDYGERINSDEIANLIFEMTLVKDNESQNKRCWNEWLEAVKDLENNKGK